MSDLRELIAIRQMLERLVDCVEAQMDHEQLRRADGLARIRSRVRQKIEDDYQQHRAAAAVVPPDRPIKRWLRKG